MLSPFLLLLLLVPPAGHMPSWVYLFASFSVVFYTWLDCFDGKQARRTGTSSPLGQLFDHGCDALSVNLLLANIGCSLGISCGWAHAWGNMLVSHVAGQWVASSRISTPCRPPALYDPAVVQ